MNILVACEESQRVCIAFRKIGHRAFSCDLEPSSGDCPEWHIKGDVIPLINGNCEFITEDGVHHKQDGRWDMILAFPPCTYLTNAGNRWFDVERYKEEAIQRYKDRYAAIVFFMRFALADCPRIVIENPVGIMSSCYRKPDQIIQPYQFGHPVSKKTCLWLKGVKPLAPTNIVEPEIIHSKGKSGGYSGNSWFCRDDNGKILSWNDPLTAKIRSKTYYGIAEAMATQWGGGLAKLDELKKAEDEYNESWKRYQDTISRNSYWGGWEYSLAMDKKQYEEAKQRYKKLKEEFSA